MPHRFFFSFACLNNFWFLNLITFFCLSCFLLLKKQSVKQSVRQPEKGSLKACQKTICVCFLQLFSVESHGYSWLATSRPWKTADQFANGANLVPRVWFWICLNFGDSPCFVLSMNQFHLDAQFMSPLTSSSSYCNPANFFHKSSTANLFESRTTSSELRMYF